MKHLNANDSFSPHEPQGMHYIRGETKAQRGGVTCLRLKVANSETGPPNPVNPKVHCLLLAS